MPLPATWGVGSKWFRVSRNTNLLPLNLNQINFEPLPFFPFVMS